MSVSWSYWTDAELEKELEIWREAIARGLCRKDNRIDLLVADIETEIARRAA